MDSSYHYCSWKNNCPPNNCTNGCPYPGPQPRPQPNHPKKSLAMAYVPWQKWCKIYSPMEALEKGTLFEELNLIFTGRGCKK